MKTRADSKPSAPPKPEKDKAGKLAREMAIYSTLIVVLPSCVLAGYWIGAALDHYFGTGSLLAMLCLMGGAAMGFHQLYRIITKVAQKSRGTGDRRPETGRSA